MSLWFMMSIVRQSVSSIGQQRCSWAAVWFWVSIQASENAVSHKRSSRIRFWGVVVVVIERVFLARIVAHTCSSSAWEADARGSRVQGHPGLFSETMFQKPKQQNKPVSNRRVFLGLRWSSYRKDLVIWSLAFTKKELSLPSTGTVSKSANSCRAKTQR